jgi:Flp pilus assembly protein TadG
MPRACAATGLLKDRSGSPALEFALIAPVMLMLLAGAYDVTRLLLVMRQLSSASLQIVQIATEQSMQPDQTISLTVQQVYQAQTAIYAVFPRMQSGNDTSAFSVTLSAAVYTASPANCVPGVTCTYTAKVAWSKALALGTQVIRPCGTISQVTSATRATIGTIPTAGMISVTSMLIADVTYQYMPMFTGTFTGPVSLRHTAFLMPRTGTSTQYVQYDIANGAANTSVCPGYL